MSRHKHCYRLHLNTLNDGNEADWVIGSVARQPVSVRELRSGWRFLLRKRSAIRWPTDTFSLLHLPTPPPPPLIDRFTIGRTLMDAHSHPPSTGDRSVKLDLRFPIDLWSIYEAIDRDNLCRPIVLWQSKEGLGRRRWIVGRLQRPGSSSFCPIWRFPVPSSGKVKNGVPSRMRNDWMVYKRRRGTSSK